jgi:glycosyltransferase involved in cell wall biosynthesis
LLRAFQKVAIKKPSARLIIAGHGPKFNELEFEVLSLALGSRVIFTGPITSEDLSDYISSADIFIKLHNRTSGFDLGVLEAMLQKKVVFAPESGPLAGLIDDGVDGFLVHPSDQEDLSRLLWAVFSQQLPLAEIGEQARNKVIQLFHPDHIVKKTIDAYRAILKF